MIPQDCEIKIITEGGKKRLVPAAIMKKPDPNEEAMAATIPKRKDTSSVDQLIHYKIPVGPLVTLNFTTNPNILFKKKKDKKKTKLSKGRKTKKLKFQEIPLPKDNNSLIQRKAMLDLANSVIQSRIDSMKSKYAVDDFIFSTEPILRWEPTAGDDPNRYLDFLREIDEELMRYKPFQVSWGNQGKI